MQHDVGDPPKVGITLHDTRISRQKSPVGFGGAEVGGHDDGEDSAAKPYFETNSQAPSSGYPTLFGKLGVGRGRICCGRVSRSTSERRALLGSQEEKNAQDHTHPFAQSERTGIVRVQPKSQDQSLQIVALTQSAAAIATSREGHRSPKSGRASQHRR
jgi:hypothetical protein